MTVALVYSDTHIATPETLSELEIAPDYSCCGKFIEIVKKERPNVVICAGDFDEPYYENYRPDFAKHLRGITHIFIKGNHDMAGQESYLCDGYLVSHKNIAHTHLPTDSNIGSLTLSHTFGEIRDGVLKVRSI